MDHRYAPLAAIAAASYGVLSRDQLAAAGVSAATVHRWVAAGLLERVGPRSLVVGGSAPTWHRALAAALVDLSPHGVLAGRSAARLHGLDGFAGDAVELLVPREHRVARPRAGLCVRTTGRPIPRTDIVLVDGLRCLRAERLILDAPRFGFDRRELENAIDSAVRLRLVAEVRLRARAAERHGRGLNGGRLLLDALVDVGVESDLERRFLTLVRRAGIERPRTQVVHRSEGRLIGRVDFQFGVDLVVEVAGHGTHASRRQRQVDAQRHTELTIAGCRVVTFTHADVTQRPGWVASRLMEALSSNAGAFRFRP